jgi:hypothetical protein
LKPSSAVDTLEVHRKGACKRKRGFNVDDGRRRRRRLNVITTSPVLEKTLPTFYFCFLAFIVSKKDGINRATNQQAGHQ